MTILVRLLQPENAALPMEVTELPMSMLARCVQLKKAFSLIAVTELGMTILVRLLQPENASLPISVTELGMTMLVRPLQL